MAKMLRLHTTGPNKDGWGATSPVEVKQILDPDGGKTTQVAVAIPSPFARLHLVEIALRFVREPSVGAVGTQSVYHRLVSHFWDVWELVFNQLQNKKTGSGLRIRPWNQIDQLKQLRLREENRPLADVLALYLSDPTSRFHNVPNLYLLYAVDANGRERLVGGTSPLTVVFPAPDLQPLSIQRIQGGGHYFDQHYVPLEKREEAFQNYVYALFVAEPGMADMATEVYKMLDTTLLQELKYANQTSTDSFPVLLDDSGNQVNVGNVIVRTRPDESVIRTSDFFIEPTRAAALAIPLEERPLVLRPKLVAPGRTYFNKTLWDDATVVPAFDLAPLHERQLPGKGLRHPFITINDFLEDTLLAVPYEIDGERFFTGRFDVKAGPRPNFWPLLPIKPLWFDYFEPKNLNELLSIELTADERPGCNITARVRLKVPIQGGRAIELERRYYSNPQEDGAGLLLDTRLGLAFFPFFQFRNAPHLNTLYKVMLEDENLDSAREHTLAELDFFSENKLIGPEGSQQRATRTLRTQKSKQTGGGTSYYEISGTSFDWLRVRQPGSNAGSTLGGQGLIVPQWPQYAEGDKTLRFAVDFGTSNTHVAWGQVYTQATTKPTPQPLSFGPSDAQVVLLKKSEPASANTPYEQLYLGVRGGGANVLRVLQQREFVPGYLGEAGSPYGFPIRTATCESPQFTSANAAVTLGNVNIGFGLNTETAVYPHYVTDLKWAPQQDPNTRERVRAFFRELLLLIRNKAAMAGGRLANTQLVWFAPLSLGTFQRDQFNDVWTQEFRDLFPGAGPAVCLTESDAPYAYLQGLGLVPDGPGQVVLNVDIGGGTTDVLAYDSGGPRLATSFRFAGRDLWGDGVAAVHQGKDNGLVAYGIEAISQAKLDGQLLAPLLQSLSAVRSNPTLGSDDVAGFLFANDQQLNFSQHLRESGPLRTLFYLHFGATMYYLGQLLAHHGLARPSYVCFTGQGSRYLRLLPGSPENLRPLEDFAQYVLDGAMQMNGQNGASSATASQTRGAFRIKLVPDPKQATANGGVLAPAGQQPLGKELLVNLVGTGTTGPTETQARPYAEVRQEAAIKDAVVANVSRCLTLLLDNPAARPHLESLGIQLPPDGLLRDLLNIQQLDESFSLALSQYAGLPATEPMPDTLFFLPLKQTLYMLSKTLSRPS
jgi:hypothetical protein